MLLGNYILFTLILVTLLISLLFFYFLRVVGIMETIDTKQINHFEESFEKEHYEDFPIKQQLGSNGFIWVLDNHQRIVYQSNTNYTFPSLSLEDIACIPDYKNTSTIIVHNLTNEQGTTNTSITIEETRHNKPFYREYILDEKKQLVYQFGDLPMNSLTTLQFQLLTDSFSSIYSIQKYVFKTKENVSQTMLLFSDKDNRNTVIGDSFRSFFLLLGIAYAIMVFFFILWLNRRIKKPLRMLSKELNCFENGKSQHAIYQGPREFVEIFDSFNAMSQRLQYSEDERQHLEVARQKMLADISHDLKTPITVIQGYAKALSDGIIPPDEQKNYLEIMEQKATGLNNLINTFYEYSKMEHPDYSLTLSPHDICNYLRDFVAERYAGLELAGFLIEIDIPEKHIFCDIDTIQLGRAFDNIVNNSIKHNPIGTMLYFSLQIESTNVRIFINDNGIGIPEDIRPIIFEPFVVGENSRCNHGSGLGLSITKKIIEAHHGTIRLKPPTPPYHTIYEILLPIK